MFMFKKDKTRRKMWAEIFSNYQSIITCSEKLGSALSETYNARISILNHPFQICLGKNK